MSTAVQTRQLPGHLLSPHVFKCRGLYRYSEYTDAITYCNKITGLYTLHPNYRELMLADNNLNTDEFIFTINYDGTYTQNWGGTTYLTHGPAAVPAKISGTSGNWGGLRCTQNFVNLFSDYR